MATVELKNVKKIYTKQEYREKRTDHKSDDDVLAVDQCNIKIADEEFVVLVGPSGCGKSTTLRMIAGLEGITAGELYINDVLMNEVEPKDRDIAMVFQEYALYPHMTVKENLEFPLKVKKMDKAEMEQRVNRAAEILDIKEYLSRKPRELSGGQKQRVAIGRAIVREPNVLLMDEPLSNLDAKLRNQMRAELLKLHKKINTTIIYVTHDQTEAMTLGDRIVIMNKGLVQQIATPQDAFEKPANIFVAGFIGTPQMNFFDGELIKGEDYQIKTGDYVETLSTKQMKILSDKGVENGSVIIGIRPQHLRIDETKTGIHGMVDVCEMMGTEVHVHVKVEDKDVVVIVPTTEVNYKDLNSGESIYLKFNNECIHLFDKESTSNLCYQ